MNLEFLTRHWALALAGVLAAVITLFIVFRVWSDSAGGQLRAMHNALLRCRQELSRQQKVADKAEKRLVKLRARADSVKPRHLQEAAEAVEDATALAKISNDQVMIAETRLRELILEEFPQNQHTALRARYFGDESR
jgi:hypothetical protein